MSSTRSNDADGGPCKTCKRQVKTTGGFYHCVGCGGNMHLSEECTGLSLSSIAVIKDLSRNLLLLCNQCVEMNKRDEIVQRSTLLQMQDKYSSHIVNKIEEKVISKLDTSLTNFMKTGSEKMTQYVDKVIKPEFSKMNKQVRTSPAVQNTVSYNTATCFRIQGIPEDTGSDKSENVIPTNEIIHSVLEKLQVQPVISHVQRLGKFDLKRVKPRTVLVTVTSNWDVRKVLAKSRQQWSTLAEEGIFILPALSKEESDKENQCLKLRREYINNGTPKENIKIKNFELFVNGAKVSPNADDKQ